MGKTSPQDPVLTLHPRRSRIRVQVYRRLASEPGARLILEIASLLKDTDPIGCMAVDLSPEQCRILARFLENAPR